MMDTKPLRLYPGMVRKLLPLVKAEITRLESASGNMLEISVMNEIRRIMTNYLQGEGTKP